MNCIFHLFSVMGPISISRSVSASSMSESMHGSGRFRIFKTCSVGRAGIISQFLCDLVYGFIFFYFSGFLCFLGKLVRVKALISPCWLLHFLTFFSIQGSCLFVQLSDFASTSFICFLSSMTFHVFLDNDSNLMGLLQPMTSVAASIMTWWNWSIVKAVSSWSVLYRFLSVMLNSSLTPWSLRLVRSNHLLLLVPILASRILRRILAVTRYNETTCTTPNMIMLGQEVATHLDIVYEIPSSKKRIAQNRWVWKLQEGLEEAQTIVRKLMNDNISRQKWYHDRKLSWKSFNKGDKVYVYFPRRITETSPKFFFHWQGNFVVIEKCSNVTYKVNCGARKTNGIRLFFKHVLRGEQKKKLSLMSREQQLPTRLTTKT